MAEQGYYRHHEGQIYRVFGTILDVPTREFRVVYGTGDEMMYGQLESRFFEEVVVDDKLISRFTFIEELER